jgi:hypothetical protein
LVKNKNKELFLAVGQFDKGSSLARARPLLLFRKTALLGAALMLPVMTNILMINVFFHIAWGAMGTSAFIFASMLAILWHHRHALVGVFWTDQAGEPASVRRYHRTIAALIVLLVITLMGFGLWLSARR